MEHVIADPVRTGPGRRVLVTGAGGQLGRALVEQLERAGDDVLALAHGDWDVTEPPPSGLGDLDLVVHAAAWTDVDGAEAEPQEAAAGEGAWIVRSSGLFGATGHNFVRTMLRLGAERDEVAVVDDQRSSPTYVGHLAAAIRELVELPRGVWHVAADGDCTWAELAAAVFEEAGLECRVRPISSAELGRPAPRPAYSVLRSERPGAPRLPHWREGLRACLDRLREP